MSPVKSRSRRVPDGRWTVAFPDEERAAYAARIIEEEMAIQKTAVEETLRPLFGQVVQYKADMDGASGDPD